MSNTDRVRDKPAVLAADEAKETSIEDADEFKGRELAGLAAGQAAVDATSST